MESEDKDFNIKTFAESCYKKHVEKHSQELMKFLNGLYPQTKKPLVVTYIDEAHNLEQSYWTLLRIVGIQDRYTRIWYIFMGTKSSLEFYNLPIFDCEFLYLNYMAIPHMQVARSLRHRQEIVHLMPPYIALGFDQNAISKDRAAVTVNMGFLQSIKHLSTYGRPMYVNLCTVPYRFLT
jgi:uncharacterized protein YlbG (UPF0298 family)